MLRRRLIASYSSATTSGYGQSWVCRQETPCWCSFLLSSPTFFLFLQRSGGMLSVLERSRKGASKSLTDLSLLWSGRAGDLCGCVDECSTIWIRGWVGVQTDQRLYLIHTHTDMTAGSNASVCRTSNKMMKCEWDPVCKIFIFHWAFYSF